MSVLRARLVYGGHARRTGAIMLWCLAGLLLLGSFPRPCESAEPSRYATIQLRNVMWQVLPEDVSSVHVGPDQRIWYGASRVYRKAAGSSFKQMVEAQFREAAPEVPSVPIALFEPQGRVWFLTDGGQTLLGYDGSAWITRTLSRPSRFVGRCPGHPRREREGYNCFFDGRAFFIEVGGVSSFDGKEWSYQSFHGPEARSRITLQAVPETGELIATAVRQQGSEFWRWHGGQWSKIDLPAGEKRVLAPWSGGRWWVYDSRGLRLESLVSGSEAIGFDRLLQKLKEAKDVNAREACVEEIVQCPDTSYKKIEQALSTTYDPELIKLLLSVRERLKSAPRGLSLRNYTLKEPWLAHNDLQGTVFIVSSDVTESGRLVGPGLVVAGITGEIRFIRGDGFARQGWQGSEDSPFYDKRQDVVWLPSRSEHPIRVLDLKTGRNVEALPSRTYRLMRAVAGDGALFVSVDDNWQKSPIVVFKPEAPDDRRLIEPKILLLNRNSSDRFCVSADGSIWADSAEDGLVLFDGKNWKKVLAGSGWGPLKFLTAGGGREALAGVGESFIYITPAGIDEDANYQRLIGRNRERIRASFSVSSLGGAEPGPLVVDGAGNIWFATEQDFRVLSGDQWLDVKSAMREAGIWRLGQPSAACTLALAGDDSVLVLPEFAGGEVFKSILAHVDRTRIMLEQGPDVARVFGFREFLPQFIRDRQGALWLPGARRSDSHQVTRLTKRGEQQSFDIVRWPVLCDAGGNLWLFSSRMVTENCYRAYPGQSLAGELRLPRGDLRFRLVDGQPGFVYACSSEVIYQLKVRSDTEPARLELVETYVPRNIEGDVSRIDGSRLGYIVMYSYTQSPPQSSLHLVPFPGTGLASRPGG